MKGLSLVLIAICIARVNTIAISRIDRFPTNSFDASSHNFKNYLLPDELAVQETRASNSTSVSSSPIVSPSTLISQLLSGLGSAIVPTLGPFAPLATLVGGWLSNHLGPLLSREFNNIGGVLQRDNIASDGEIETFHITIPNQGTYTLMTKRPHGLMASTSSSNMNYYGNNLNNMAHELDRLEEEKHQHEMLNEERLLPITKLIWTIIRWLIV